MKPRIALICAKFTPTVCGVGDYTLKLARELKSAGAEICVVTRSQGCPREVDGIPVFQPVARWRAFRPASLKKALEAFSPDIIHLQYEPFGYRQSFMIPMFTALSKTPVVATLHEVWHPHRFYEWRDRFIYEKCRRLIVNDQGCLERLLRISPGAAPYTMKVGVGSNIATSPRWRPRAGAKAFTLGYFGFLNRNKRCELMFHALNELKRDHGLDVRLKILSPFAPDENPYHRSLANLCSALNLVDRVAFKGALDAEAVAAEFAGCDLAILPFTDGASPRRGTFQAATSLGLPIVTSPPSSREERIVEGRTAVFFDSNKDGDLASRAAEILKNQNFQNRLSEGALEYATGYTWNAIARVHLAVYESLAKGPDRV